MPRTTTLFLRQSLVRLAVMSGLAIMLSSCASQQWIWVSGSNTVNEAGTYGTKGVADPINVPKARNCAVSWIDSSNNLWLFGGYVHGGGPINDLWKFDGAHWTWVSGSNLGEQSGNYGTKGVAAPNNVPGGRGCAISWVDRSNNLWLFGGTGYVSESTPGHLNDLWKFDGTNWTWVSGSNLVHQRGDYGTKGVAAPTNAPGARRVTVSWIDSSNNLWLFGGYGFDSSGEFAELNDLWKFDGTNWTWVSGSNIINQSGIYGNKGVAASANVPGARYAAVSWIDHRNYLWLFGGHGFDSAGQANFLNDLWKFDGSNWTWVSGSNLVLQGGHFQGGDYGTKGVAAPTNIPGSRMHAVSWVDSRNTLWLFGGEGIASAQDGRWGMLNDLWRFDPVTGMWTWISGKDANNQAGNYGTKNVAAPTNIPGARRSAVSWTDSSNNLWLYGGDGLGGDGRPGNLSDLWRYVP